MQLTNNSGKGFNMKLIKRLSISVLILIATTQSVLAGSTQEAENKHPVEDVMTFAKQVEKYAANKGARAFIIARVGQPEKDLPKGIKFTHTAIAVYSEIKLNSGETVFGYAIHNLYQNSKDLNESQIITDYPVDFFWGVESLKAGIIIPNEKLQQRIVETIASNKHKQLHNPNYSLVANPFNSEYQNCTEHTLDVINASVYQTTDIKRLKTNAKNYFKPQRVYTSGFKLAMGNWFAAGVHTDDHNGRVKTATFTTIARYLEQNKLMQSATVAEFENGELVTEQLNPNIGYASQANSI